MSKLITVKPFHKGKEHGVEMTLKLTEEKLSGAIEKQLVSKHDIELATKAFTIGRCGRGSLQEFLKTLEKV